MDTTISRTKGDCYADPSICGVRPNFEVCVPAGDGSKTGVCASPAPVVDCYAEGDPDVCGDDMWCQLNDRKSWNDTDMTTMGRCVQYQAECESCTSTNEEDNPPHLDGINAYAFVSESDTTTAHPFGTYLQRATRCNPSKGLVCTGDHIPALPATCVQRRRVPPAQALKPWYTADDMHRWAKRLMRMGARNLQGTGGMSPEKQLPQGNPRSVIQEGANKILYSLVSHFGKAAKEEHLSLRKRTRH